MVINSQPKVYFNSMLRVLLISLLLLSSIVFSQPNSVLLAEGLASCAGTYKFAQEIYKNANNDERVKIFQDLSSQYLSASEASFFLLKDKSISPRKIAENNMQKTFNLWIPRFKQLMTEEGRKTRKQTIPYSKTFLKISNFVQLLINLERSFLLITIIIYPKNNLIA